MAEYSVPSSCSYSSLKNYSRGGAMNIHAPQRVGVDVRGSMIAVPVYGSLGYNSLTHNVKEPSCSGFFNVKNAYSSAGGNCAKFTTRACAPGSIMNS